MSDRYLRPIKIPGKDDILKFSNVAYIQFKFQWMCSGMEERSKNQIASLLPILKKSDKDENRALSRNWPNTRILGRIFLSLLLKTYGIMTDDLQRQQHASNQA